jgi:hypothetical protein
LFFLPGYAPELNPDELVWSHMKRTGTVKRPLAAKESLQDRIEADLFKIQKSPNLVRSFFNKGTYGEAVQGFGQLVRARRPPPRGSTRSSASVKES